MRVVVIVLLMFVCIFGRFALRWRRVARTGFGLGVTNVPRLLRSGSGNAFVWSLGWLTFAGPAILLFGYFAWYWSLLAIFVAGGLERPLLAFLCRGDLEAALRFKQQHKELFDELHRLEGTDPVKDALD